VLARETHSQVAGYYWAEELKSTEANVGQGMHTEVMIVTKAEVGVDATPESIKVGVGRMKERPRSSHKNRCSSKKHYLMVILNDLPHMKIRCTISDVARDEWILGDVAKNFDGIFDIFINDLLVVTVIPDLNFSRAEWEEVWPLDYSEVTSLHVGRIIRAQTASFVIASNAKSTLVLESFEIDCLDMDGNPCRRKGYIQWVPTESMARYRKELRRLWNTPFGISKNTPIEVEKFAVLRLIDECFVQSGLADYPPVGTK
jgi:hypothetical protein